MKRTTTTTSAMTFRIGNMPETSSNAERNLVKFHKVSVGGEECVFPIFHSRSSQKKNIWRVYMRHAYHSRFAQLTYVSLWKREKYVEYYYYILCVLKAYHV